MLSAIKMGVFMAKFNINAVQALSSKEVKKNSITSKGIYLRLPGKLIENDQLAKDEVKEFLQIDQSIKDYLKTVGKYNYFGVIELIAYAINSIESEKTPKKAKK